jgi:hypothetical protein
LAEELGRVVVKQFKGRGRRATLTDGSSLGGWLFRLYMAWFSSGLRKP